MKPNDRDKQMADQSFECLDVFRREPPTHAILNRTTYGHELTLGTLTASEPMSNEKGLFTLIKIALNNGAETFEII